MVTTKKVLKKPTAKVKSQSYSFKFDQQYFSILNSSNTRLLHLKMFHSETEISCGVMQVSGLPLNSQFNTLFKEFGAVKGLKIFTEGLTKYFQYVKDGAENYIDESAFLILSNSLDKNSTIVNDVLSKICYRTEDRKNPNTKNTIRVYIY